MASTYLELGQAAGIHPDLLHRITAIATSGLDSLPYNGAAITLLGDLRRVLRDSDFGSHRHPDNSQLSGIVLRDTTEQVTTGDKLLRYIRT